MSFFIATLAALTTLVVMYNVLFDSARHFLSCWIRVIGFGFFEEIFPGFTGPKEERWRPVVWWLSGVLVGSLGPIFFSRLRLRLCGSVL
jgi:hypothetical protein